MKEPPILFSAPMARAIHDGRKTQTRRSMKPQPPSSYRLVHIRTQDTDYNPITGVAGLYAGFDTRPDDDLDPLYYRSPYGQPGDRLWAREEHFRFGHWEMIPGVKTKGGRQKWKFVADDGYVRFADEPGAPKTFRKGRHHKDPSTPAWHKRLARFMPRKFSRITLEITGVRIERLKDISEADAKAEGIIVWESDRLQRGDSAGRQDYKALWESINGPGSWALNPWVWVITFKKL